ncbi:class I fructose-bisphosphate aldolase [Estrella lausannensis]|uniref:fructose-bisphosphate aldolase n=1 Tax=Estrella lausannensis TaxID=483423 RepID=A0A0H5DSV1_9BACT|nr:class I fructose-bisphosphate aldolase [Estrella lausannensis]CRX39408.1 Fructose-bisphosphate aldolase [Estrella lausannensis]
MQTFAQLKSELSYKDIQSLLGKEAEELLDYRCTKIRKEQLPEPGPNWVDRIFKDSDRNNRVLGSLEALFGHGRLKDTGYLSILPVDQGIEHSAGASFAPNPLYFDPENIVRLAVEAGCNGVASTLGVLGMVARKYAHKIPFILKINHNELLSFPNTHDQILFTSVKRAYDMGAKAVGATIYFGSQESHHQIQEISEAFEMAHELGLATILWCYLRNPAFKIDGTDYHLSADLTGQANHLGQCIGADIVKQKLPLVNGGYKAMNQLNKGYGKWSEKMYSDLCDIEDNPIDLCRYQVLNTTRVGLINSGGESGKNDLHDAVKTAVINKRAGGIGLISGRKTFQRPMKEGVQLFHAIQDVYLCKEIGLA